MAACSSGGPSLPARLRRTDHSPGSKRSLSPQIFPLFFLFSPRPLSPFSFICFIFFLLHGHAVKLPLLTGTLHTHEMYPGRWCPRSSCKLLSGTSCVVTLAVVSQWPPYGRSSGMGRQPNSLHTNHLLFHQVLASMQVPGEEALACLS